MKWYEILEDFGDGSSGIRRFKTEESARNWLTTRVDYPGEEDCYPYGPIEEVDTDSKYFWSGLE